MVWELAPRWGTAQLLANLGDALWIQAAGSEAAVAAVLSLKSLEAADEARNGRPRIQRFKEVAQKWMICRGKRMISDG